jgi:3-deoxy-7-phosphoheptulonate synthase
MSETTQNQWHPLSWKDKPAQQLPTYPDQDLLQKKFTELKSLPPLVTSWEIEQLRDKLKQVARGEAFILQGGDCAESFDRCTDSVIVNSLKVMLQMSLVMIHEMDIPLVRIARLAGQYAKPRSNDTEIVNGVELPTYRGDLINGFEPTLEARTPDPNRLVEGYQRASLTLNFIRSLTESSGFADLHHPEYWELDFMRQNKYYQEYKELIDSITRSIKFVESISPNRILSLKQVNFYTSHEALNLFYESAQTRKVPHRDGFFNLSAHMVWLGNRTRDLKSAHVEYLSGIQNPIGIKVGPPYEVDEILKLIETLNPKNEEGKIVLISRYGRKKIGDMLPKMIREVKRAGLNVIWTCDPMHGNTFSTDDSIKTRHFDDIIDEIKQTFQIHKAESSRLKGVHLELTGNNVTECVGGATGLDAEGLKDHYESYCDPRLNYEQSLEMAFLISQEWKNYKKAD